MSRLEGQVAIVTGSSRGIGRALALALAREGCAVCVTAKSVREKENLPGTIHSVAEEIEEAGGRALAVRCDVRKEEEIEAMVAETVEAFGGLDILINNAGALWWQPVLETPTRRFDLVMDVNVRGSFLCARAALPHLIEGGGGHILNMSPPIDTDLLSGRVAYFISKYGMTFLSLGLADEVREKNVAVNSLWPVTLIESQATINYEVGDPSMWRKPDIMADATLAIVTGEPMKRTGRALLDEEVLREEGRTDFSDYACVPGTEPPPIHWNLADEE